MNTIRFILIAAITSAVIITATNYSKYRQSNNASQIRDYQLAVYNDSTQIWDGNRLVATIPYDSASKFDLAINKDNE